MAKMTNEQLVHMNWGPWDIGAGGFTHDVLRTAAAMHTAKIMDRAAQRLQSIIERLDMLGKEGLHEVLRELASEVRAKKKRRIARRRRARLASIPKAA